MWEGLLVNSEWVNYGDANPDIHGGRFIKFIPSFQHWKLIQTEDAYWVDGDLIHVSEYWIDSTQIVNYEDDEMVWKDIMHKIFDQFQLEYPTPKDYPNERPIEYFLVDVPFFASGFEEGQYIEPEKYWEILEDCYGIKEGEV